MANLNQSGITKLKKLILDTLVPEINNDYVLLDVPDYDNIGDNLIWEGQLAFLKNVPYKMIYEASYLFYKQNQIPKNAVILLQGGGNFGDIYQKTQALRLKIIKENPDKKIILFPQTFFYKDKNNLEQDAQIINAHPDLILCVRDVPSMDLAKEHFPNAEVKLLPDMAFCIDLSLFDVPAKSDKTLLMNRRDGEFNEKSIKISGEYDTSDWPGFNMKKEDRWRLVRNRRRMDKVAVALQNIPLINSLVDTRYGLKSGNRREKYIQTGIDFFSQYKIIYTTRLHGLILGVLMGKDMRVLDNSYGKLTAFYEAWLKDFENVEVIEY